MMNKLQDMLMGDNLIPILRDLPQQMASVPVGRKLPPAPAIAATPQPHPFLDPLVDHS